MDPKILRSYASYFVRWLDAYKKASVTVYAVTPQNERNITNRYPTCLWSGSQLHEFIVRHLGPALKEHHPDVELWLGLKGDPVSGQTQTIGQRLELEKPHAIALPAHRFDPCTTTSVLIDKYQTAMFEHNGYSVPKWAAYRPATVKAYVGRVEIVQDNKLMASHPRSYEKDRWVVERSFAWMARFRRRAKDYERLATLKKLHLAAFAFITLALLVN